MSALERRGTAARHTALLFVAILLAASTAVTSALLQPAQAFASSEDGKVSRAIAIGYDNSGSMGNGSSKWCGAWYSLEVLASMLDANDDMVLYAMDAPGEKLAINGSQGIADRVGAVHNADLGVADSTDPRAAADALAYLKSSPADEKYLIITTDGNFNEGGGIDDVKRTVQEASAQGMTVIYLAIGDGVDTIDSDPAAGIYVKVATSDNILKVMVEIANQVFGRDSLPSGSVDTGAGKLTFDVPMSQLVVFAQGENVGVGNLTTADGETIEGAQAQVKYNEKPTRDEGQVAKYSPYEVDSNLQGIVCSFEGDIPQGEAQVSVEGASSVEVYYTPRVGIAVDLKSADSSISYPLKPGEENPISAGTYTAELYFVDPLETDKRIYSDLLKDPSFKLQVESGGDLQTVEQGGQLTISPGKATILASATTNGSVHVSQEYENVNVSQPVSPMRMDASAVPATLALDGFDGARFPVMVSHDDKSSFSQEEWQNLELTVEDDSGIEWAVEKSEEPGTLYVTPKLVEGDQGKTQQALFGGLPFDAAVANLHLTAETEAGDKAYRANEDRSIGYVGDWKLLLPIIIPLLIGLALLLLLLVLYLIKPRLPRKMHPHLVIASQDEPIALRYNDKNIKNRYSPLGPETIVFSAHAPRDPMEANTLRLPERYELSRIGLVASKKEGGKRRFKFDEQTLSDMRRHMANAQERDENRVAGLPDPDYSPRPAKSFKDQKSSRGVGSTITFTGHNVPPRGKKKQEETYTIYFRKPR